jgi:hypothetical protein
LPIYPCNAGLVEELPPPVVREFIPRLYQGPKSCVIRAG